LLTRYLVGAVGAFIGGAIIITILFALLGHLWFVSLGLGLIWSLCLQIVAWGSAYVFWPDATRQFQARLRNSYPQSVVEVSRRLDRSVGLEIEGPNLSSTARLRALGIVLVAVMVVVGLAASWVILAAIGH
jgi:hypothetical protein